MILVIIELTSSDPITESFVELNRFAYLTTCALIYMRGYDSFGYTGSLFSKLFSLLFSLEFRFFSCYNAIVKG